MKKPTAVIQTSVYQWRPRMKFNIDPQLAGTELEKIRGHNSGDLSPEAVLKAAEQETSPLHPLFDWDNDRAAHQHRLGTANLLIRSIVVTVTSAGPQTPQPINVSVTASTAAGGTASARVVSETELHQAKVQRGWEELDKWTKIYAGLPEFAQIGMVLSAFLPKKDKAA